MRAHTALGCLALVFLAAACVDGTTPDCSDAAANCGPDEGGLLLDATPSGDGASVDGGKDASQDAGQVSADAQVDG